MIAAIFRAKVRRAIVWLHAFGEQALVEIVERSLAAAGHGRRTLEDGFQIMIMILIEPTQLLWFLGTLQLSSHVTVLRTVARLNRQTAVGPQLPLGAEPMGVWISAISSALESDRSKESGAVIWSRSVSGSRPTDPAAPLAQARRASSCW